MNLTLAARGPSTRSFTAGWLSAYLISWMPSFFRSPRIYAQGYFSVCRQRTAWPRCFQRRNKNLRARPAPPLSQRIHLCDHLLRRQPLASDVDQTTVSLGPTLRGGGPSGYDFRGDTDVRRAYRKVPGAGNAQRSDRTRAPGGAADCVDSAMVCQGQQEVTQTNSLLYEGLRFTISLTLPRAPPTPRSN